MQKLRLDFANLSVESFATKTGIYEKEPTTGNTGPMCNITGFYDCPTEYRTCVNCLYTNPHENCGGGGESEAVSHQPPCC